MSAATAPLDSQRKEADVVSMYTGATTIYAGTMVTSRVTDGNIYPARNGTSTDVFQGVAYDNQPVAPATAGSARLRVQKTGSYVFTKNSATAATDVGLPFYAFDDSTVTPTSTNAQLVGYCEEVIDSTHVRIRIDLAAK